MMDYYLYTTKTKITNCNRMIEDTNGYHNVHADDKDWTGIRRAFRSYVSDWNTVIMCTCVFSTLNYLHYFNYIII